MPKHLTLMLFALLFSGCNSVRRDLLKSATIITLSKEQVAQVKTGVSRGLKDPESARFEEPFIAADDGQTIHVCGYVNARNSYGGYVGIKPFYALGDHLSKTFKGAAYGGEMYRAEDIGSNVVREMCSKAGITLF